MLWMHDFSSIRAAPHRTNSLSRSRSAAGWREPLRLYNLRLPFVVRVTARRGEHRLASARRSGILIEGASLVVPAYRLLHYEGATITDARAGHELHLHIDDDSPNAAIRVTDGAAPSLRHCDTDQALSIRLARAVFLNPAADWSSGRMAEHAGMTPRELSTQLFREGSALTAIVREQRLMRALFALLAPPPAQADLKHLAVQAGFASFARFDAMASRHFRCSTAKLAKLAWCPALTWSTAFASWPSDGMSNAATPEGAGSFRHLIQRGHFDDNDKGFG